jgi:hypothetical protein
VVCDALAKTLAHAAGLKADLLVGYAANFDFWWEEVRHAMRLIDGYNERFHAFENAQLAYAEAHEYQQLPQIERSVPGADRREARRSLIDGWTKFARRCAKEHFIKDGQLKAVLSAVS